jgi:hypothetical protein
MDLNKVKALLADYYKGQTSVEEEVVLKNFFTGSEVPPEMENDRQLFLSLVESSKDEMPDEHFDEKLLLAIDELEKKRISRHRFTRMVISVSGIAAGILILAGSYFFLVEKRIDQGFLASEKYSINETQLAYEEARNALLLVSLVMNSGTAHLEPLSKMTEATRSIGMLSKFHEGANKLQAISIFDEAVIEISGEIRD